MAVRGDVVIATTTAGASAQSSTSGASLRFDSTVDGPGSLTASSRGHLVFAGNAGFLTTLDSLTATAPIITLNNTRTLNQLKVDALTTLAIGSDGSDGLVNLVGGFYSSLGGSVLFNPTNRPAVSKHATILSNAGNLVISAAGDFFMGNEQKLLVSISGPTVTLTGPYNSATVTKLNAFTPLCGDSAIHFIDALLIPHVAVPLLDTSLELKALAGEIIPAPVRPQRRQG